MKDKQYLFLIALVALATCSNVIKLTDSTFNQTITTHKYVMVKFYAPWCGHCKTMIPQYERLAELTKDNGVVIAQVDATQQNQTAATNQIQGFPTIKLYIDGLPVDYKGARKADDMYGWIKKVSETILSQITPQKINQLKEKQSLVVYHGKDSQRRKTVQFLNIVDSTIDCFVNSNSDDQKIVLYPLGKQSIQYTSTLELNLNQLKAWVMINTLPTVVPLKTKEYLDWVFYDEATQKDVLMLLRQSDVNDKGFENLEQFCLNNKESFKCCVVDQSMDVFGGVQKYLRSTGNSVLALTKDSLKEAYTYPHNINELTQQSWNQFVSQVKQSKHKNLASEESDKIEYQFVKVLTDDNFTEFIKQNEVVFVQFYSPGCGHCVEFAPAYDILAKNVYADKKANLQIAAVDVKNNKKVAQLTQVMNFPSFKVYLSGQDVSYQGPRTQQSIMNFIESVKNSKPILASSIAQIPTPAVIIYDSANPSTLNLLPALFTRYPTYQILQGKAPKVVLRTQQEQTYAGEYSLQAISKWLHKKTDPTLVDLLNANMENKLLEALQSKIHILALIDTDAQLSTSLHKTLEQYCKASTLVCGFAKKGEANFNQFTKWAGVDVEGGSQILYINTQSFDKYLFNKKIEQLNLQNIGQFIESVKQGKVEKISGEETQSEQQNQQKQQAQEQKGQQTEQPKAQTETDDKSQEQSQESNDQKQSQQSEGQQGEEQEDSDKQEGEGQSDESESDESDEL